MLYSCSDVQTQNIAKIDKFRKTEKKDGRFLQIPVNFSGFRRGMGI